MLPRGSDERFSTALFPILYFYAYFKAVRYQSALTIQTSNVHLAFF